MNAEKIDKSKGDLSACLCARTGIKFVEKKGVSFITKVIMGGYRIGRGLKKCFRRMTRESKEKVCSTSPSPTGP